MPYVSPKGGTRRPALAAAPSVGRVPMYSWRQPTGGVRTALPR